MRSAQFPSIAVADALALVPCSEKDVDEVLQIANVFTNVSKGAVAKTADLQAAFRTTSIPDIVREILLKGELQVGEKERSHALGNLWKEVAGLVADKVVDPGTKRPYSVSMIEKAMQEVHFNVRAERSAKSQVSAPWAFFFEGKRWRGQAPRKRRGKGMKSASEIVEGSAIVFVLGFGAATHEHGQRRQMAGRNGCERRETGEWLSRYAPSLKAPCNVRQTHHGHACSRNARLLESAAHEDMDGVFSDTSMHSNAFATRQGRDCVASRAVLHDDVSPGHG